MRYRNTARHERRRIPTRGHRDAAIDDLGETDRGAVILRFLEQRSFADIGRVLGLSGTICLVVTLAVGLVPAFQTRHLALADTLKTEASAVMGARGRA